MVFRSTTERARLIQEWKKSGLSKRKFCQKYGIANSTFASWFSMSTLLMPEPDTKTVQVVQVGTMSLAMGRRIGSGVSLEVGDVKIKIEEGFSAEVLTQVLEVLKQCSA